MTDLLVWGVVAHLFADWILQNHWMAVNKANLKHPAGYVHAGIHFLALCSVFPVAAAGVLALVHLAVDTRHPLVAWRRFFRQTQTGDAAMHVAIWGDQVVHVLSIALAARILTG